MKKLCKLDNAFTLVEVLIVVMILAIIAAIAMPLYTSAASTQLSTAATVIASDLEYAKNLAMTTGRTYSVVFDTSLESYSIKDSNGQKILHPTRVNEPYEINFRQDSRLDRVDIVSANFSSTSGTASTVKFDYLGIPRDSAGNPLNSGEIFLSAEGISMKVKIEPMTGYIRIE